MQYLTYQYRDANNYKQNGTVALTEPLTREQAKRIMSTLDEGIYFIPAQVGLPSLIGLFVVLDPEADHPWHYFPFAEWWDEDEGMESVHSTFLSASVVGPFVTEDFVQKFESIGRDGWDDAA